MTDVRIDSTWNLTGNRLSGTGSHIVSWVLFQCGGCIELDSVTHWHITHSIYTSHMHSHVIYHSFESHQPDSLTQLPLSWLEHIKVIHISFLRVLFRAPSQTVGNMHRQTGHTVKCSFKILQPYQVHSAVERPVWSSSHLCVHLRRANNSGYHWNDLYWRRSLDLKLVLRNIGWTFFAMFMWNNWRKSVRIVYGIGVKLNQVLGHNFSFPSPSRLARALEYAMGFMASPRERMIQIDKSNSGYIIQCYSCAYLQIN